MKNIDFLPDIYRHRQVLQHARLWWGGVAVLFTLAIGGTATAQWLFRRALAAQIAVVEPQYAAALEQDAQSAAMQVKLAQAEELAGLYLYLRHPWPRTQLLAAVAEPLPESIRLLDLHLIEETGTATATSDHPAETNTTHAAGETEQTTKPSAAADLASLRAECDSKKTVLELSGQASNIVELHTYVGSLPRSPLIASASLKTLESGNEASTAGLSKFQLRVVVRPGYGQPGGAPAKPAALAATASQGVVAQAATERGEP